MVRSDGAGSQACVGDGRGVLAFSGVFGGFIGFRALRIVVGFTQLVTAGYANSRIPSHRQILGFVVFVVAWTLRPVQGAACGLIGSPVTQIRKERSVAGG